MKSKLMIVLMCVFLIQIAIPVYAITKDNFVLNVIHEESPVREIDEKVILHFGQEYKLRLKNGHDRKATARVWIDGAKVSQLGDFILDPNSTFDLERFLDSSLTDGKRFKFVSLNHPDVDDPSRKENGLVKVEFRLEKKKQTISPEGYIIVPFYSWDDTRDRIITLENKVYTSFEYSSVVEVSNTSGVLPGATIPGSDSTQSFQYAHVDVEDDVTVLTLKIEGINDEK